MIHGGIAMDYRPNRLKTSVLGCLSVDGDRLEIVVLDVSRDGAKVTLPYPVLVGTAVRLEIGNSTVSALIQWYREGRAGLRLLDRLDRETLLAIEQTTARGTAAE